MHLECIPDGISNAKRIMQNAQQAQDHPGAYTGLMPRRALPRAESAGIAPCARVFAPARGPRPAFA
jgi:hypothetical protein